MSHPFDHLLPNGLPPGGRRTGRPPGAFFLALFSCAEGALPDGIGSDFKDPFYFPLNKASMNQ